MREYFPETRTAEKGFEEQNSLGRQGPKDIRGSQLYKEMGMK